MKRLVLLLLFAIASACSAQVEHGGLRIPGDDAVQIVAKKSSTAQAAFYDGFDIVLLYQDYSYNTLSEARCTNRGKSAGDYAYQTIEVLKPLASQSCLYFVGSVDTGTQQGLLIDDIDIASNGITVFAYSKSPSASNYEHLFGRVNTERTTGWACGGQGVEINYGLGWYNGYNQGVGQKTGGRVNSSWAVTCFRGTPGVDIDFFRDGSNFASTTTSIPAWFNFTADGPGLTVGIGAELRWSGSAWELKYGHSGYIDSIFVKYEAMSDADILAFSNAIIANRGRSTP